jgi:sterol desaturase/sphingolipid hydroxylase (fatty acid hydroxylase superfamily)
VVQYIVEHEPLIRLSCFVGIFAAVALGEIFAPRRSLVHSKSRRWLVNIGITATNSLILRLFVPVLAAGFAARAEVNGWGLLNMVDLPGWFEIIIAVIVLDLLIYLQHLFVHAVPILWRLHMVHHIDLDIDVTTGARFHPLEILFSMGIKLAAVALLGPAVVAVIIFEILLNATAMFNHGNFRLPLELDRVLRFIVVTPDMHRVHHSIRVEETNSNYGFNLPWWDRLFGTYRAQPQAGHDLMTIGITPYSSSPRLGFVHAMLLPLVSRTGRYPDFFKRPSNIPAQK